MRHNRASSWVAILLLLLFFAQTVTAATQTSLTSDEGPQLTSGYSYLITGDPHLIEFDGHPPLAKVMNAAPMLLIPDLDSPVKVPAWSSEDPISLLWVAEQFLYPYRPLERVLFPGRVLVALLGVLVGALVYRWATDLFGPLAGLGALLLVTFDPNLLAHAGLATNDVAVTLGSLAALFAFWRFLRRPTLSRSLLAGLVLGLAQGTKLNALLLFPVQALLGVVYVFWLYRTSRDLPPSSKYSLLSWIKGCAVIWLVAGFVLWATYGFELRVVGDLPLPVPAGTHLFLLERVAQATGGGHPGFLMGEISTQGWWHYFPVAFAIKTPLPTLIVLLAAVIAFLAGWRRRLGDEIVPVLFIVLYAAFTIWGRLNIGYRHLLPILPFLFIFSARLFDLSLWLAWSEKFRETVRRSWQNAIGAGAASLLVVWLILGTVTMWPFYLAFFNESVGGPDQGYRYLVDSNTDWGQTLKALNRHLQSKDIDRVRLSTYIEYGPAFEAYGLQVEPLPPLHDAPGVLPARFNPPPGVYAISTTTLQGIFTADPEMYDWFRRREPDARIGHVLFLYRVPEPREPGTWVAQCIVPTAPLPPEVIAEGFGIPDLRRAYFDCTQSWLVPGGGASPGWYVLFRDTAHNQDTFIETQLDATRLSFEQTQSKALPPFSIFETTTLPARPDQPAQSQVRVGDLTFLGHTVLRQQSGTVDGAEEQIEVWTFWHIEAVPQRPLSLMLHMIGPGGTPAVVGDGLGVPLDNWQSGDIIVQRHHLVLPPDAPAGDYALYSGAYWLDNLERWAVEIEGQPAGDRVMLPSIHIDPVAASR
jgi:hypothetical protein